MRNKQEIIDYLRLPEPHEQVNAQLIKAAERVEKDFERELDEGVYGYGLLCDFENSPFILEDEDKVEELVQVANYDGVIVYRIIFKEEHTNETTW